MLQQWPAADETSIIQSPQKEKEKEKIYIYIYIQIGAASKHAYSLRAVFTNKAFYLFSTALRHNRRAREWSQVATQLARTAIDVARVLSGRQRAALRPKGPGQRARPAGKGPCGPIGPLGLGFIPKSFRVEWPLRMDGHLDW